jgi:phenylacetate-CoA ligase
MTVYVPLSPFDDIAWPAPVVGKQATYLGLQFQLEQSQWWSEDELVSAQLKQLSLLLQHAVNTVPYYKKCYSKIPFDFSGRLTLNEWRRLPILTRDDLQKAGNSLNSKAVPKRHGDLHNQRSSGSTGKPVSIKQTALSNVYWESFTLRESLWHKRDMRSKLAVIRHSRNVAKRNPKGLRGGGWGSPYEGMYETGPGVYMHSSEAIPDQAEWLLCEEPDYLLAYPSVLHELARYFIKNGLELSNLKHARAFGEVLDENTRQACRQAWNVTVVDGYSSNEVGNMAFQCPEHEHLHIQSESLLLEILDDAGNPCRPGETGRVIVTPLHNYATPLLRYAVGDYAEVGAACDCGRGLPVIKRVLGRSRNLATMPDGRKFWPGIQLTDFGKIAPVTQAQLVQHSIEHLEARLVVDTAVTHEQEVALAKLIQELFGFSFLVTFSYLDEIPRSPTDKYEDFLSEV